MSKCITQKKQNIANFKKSCAITMLYPPPPPPNPLTNIEHSLKCFASSSVSTISARPDVGGSDGIIIR